MKTVCVVFKYFTESLKSQTWANKRVVYFRAMDAYISHLYDDDEKFDLFIYEQRLNLIFEKLNFICKLQ